MVRIAPAITFLARKERLIVAVGLTGVVLAGWLYLVQISSGMADMSGSAMPMLKEWSAADAVFMFLMWAVMMATMMIPSAAPMILLYTAIRGKSQETGGPVAHTGLFAAGYITVWTGFSAAATLAQWGLESAALLSPMMASASPVFGGAVLILAGLYQMTPLKHVCLAKCSAPAQFISRHWRKGATGAFRMGFEHGLFCLGCCWALMLLLFVGGVMSFLWIAGLSVFVLLEKVLPKGALVARIVGTLLILSGIWMATGI